MMSDFKIGEMFWGKSTTYPWWPCVIVPNDKNEVKNRTKKFGIQYHVQFIGKEYDPCWLNHGYLVEYQGKDNFEQYVIDQLNSTLPAPEKLKFDMRMSQAVKVNWIQACSDAEAIFPKSLEERLTLLPKATPIDTPKLLNKKNISVNESKKPCAINVKGILVKKSKKNKILPKKSNTKLFDNKNESDIEDETTEVTVKRKEKRKSDICSSTISYKEDEFNETETKEAINIFKEEKSISKRLSDNEYKSEFDLYKDESHFMNDSLLSSDIEERCFRAYLAQETHHRIENTEIDRNIIENILKDQWGALDIDTKLLYLNDEISFIFASKSKVSGRPIKIPSRLRRTEDISKIRRSTLNTKNQNEPPIKKRCTNSVDSSSAISVKIEPLKTIKSSPSLNGVNTNSIPKESLDDSLWDSLSIKNCITEMMEVVLTKISEQSIPLCCHCFKPLTVVDKLLTCKGPCHATFHESCALRHKLLCSGDNSLCVNCNHKQDICYICKTSKHMKNSHLVKCQKEGCTYYFHVTCSKLLILSENIIERENTVICPNHSCLTCTREDNKHDCNNIGTFVSCIKCPISYHDNFICIPAGCKVVNKNKIICYRHFDNIMSPKKLQPLSQCFICFKENATLKCCRCQTVFHPKCLSLGTSDLLQDYICTSCRLDQPLFNGQIMWHTHDHTWVPCEILLPCHLKGEIVGEDLPPIIIRNLKNSCFYFVHRCELIPFFTGLSLLKDLIDNTDAVVQKGKLWNVLYWNWRSRLRPVTFERFPIISQSELIRYSVEKHQLPDPMIETYKVIDKSIVSKHIKTLIPQRSSESCCCSSSTGTCSDEQCRNFTNNIECSRLNCTNMSCNNRIFVKKPSVQSIVINKALSCRGIKLDCNVEENRLLGEYTGTFILSSLVYERMNNRQDIEHVSYVFHLQGDIFLDCEETGNAWRHLNHSCDPNAKVICRNIAGSLKLGVLSLKPITTEEVTIDYINSGIVLKYGFVCQCHSSNCRKIIGPTSIFENVTDFLIPQCCNSNSLITDRKPVLSIIADNNVTDDSITDKVSCFKCGTHGEFISCDKSSCKKQYHMFCLHISTKPIGIWFCPLHFCAYCGHAATKFCDRCPISSCKKHLQQFVDHLCTINKVSDITDETTEPMMLDLSMNENNVDIRRGIEKDDDEKMRVEIINEKFLQEKRKVEEKNNIVVIKSFVIEKDEEKSCTVNNENIVKGKENEAVELVESNLKNKENHIEKPFKIIKHAEENKSLIVVDSDDVRFEIIPCSLKEAEDEIVSPSCLLD